jgi:DNA (cytosine-5)-methyltransferase 1
LAGGSKKHGGPDLGPTRARNAWDKLGVDGKGVADCPPAKGFAGKPRITVSAVREALECGSNIIARTMVC